MKDPTQIAEKLAFDLFGTDATPREKRKIQSAIEEAVEEDHSFMLTEVKRVADDRDYWRTLAQSRDCGEDTAIVDYLESLGTTDGVWWKPNANSPTLREVCRAAMKEQK